MSDTAFIVLSFEGPDTYSHAGGLGSRVRELSEALAGMGHETHLFFIGDPTLPGVETRANGKLHLHRWCQWISEHHPIDVYDGEDGKVLDWSVSIPLWLESNLLPKLISANRTVVVLAEEWQTVGSVVGLKDVIDRNGWDQKVHTFWNLNNLFGTDRIDWNALKSSAVITTVSRYMKHVMWRFGVDARVVPNGISASWFEPPARDAVSELRKVFKNRLALAKVARWDPDKRWNMAVDALAIMKQEGLDPVLVARGGTESHGAEVMERAEKLGLSITRVGWDDPSPAGFVHALRAADRADILLLQGYLNQPQLKVLYRAADAVLANSGVEPFGLVGLEVMAAGGLAFIGSTGEDYATPGYDCVSVQTHMPAELAYQAAYVKSVEAESRTIRRNGQHTARRFAWPSVIGRTLVPMIHELGGHDSAIPLHNGTPIGMWGEAGVPGSVKELTQMLSSGSLAPPPPKATGKTVLLPGYNRPWPASSSTGEDESVDTGRSAVVADL